MAMEKHSSLYLGVPKRWGGYEPCRVLVVRVSFMFAYLEWKFVDEREPSSSIIGGTCVMWHAQIIVLRRE